MGWIKRGGCSPCAREKREGKETCRTSSVEGRLCWIGVVMDRIALERRAATRMFHIPDGHTLVFKIGAMIIIIVSIILYLLRFP